MTQKLTTLLIAILISITAIAADVNLQRAANIAKKYYFQHSGIATEMSLNKLQIELHTVYAEMGDTAFCIFNVCNAPGFIIVPMDDRVKPVLAFSTKGSFDRNNMAPGLAGMLNDYQEQLLLIKRGQASVAVDYSDKWNDLESQALRSVNSIPPQPLLLMDWSQGWPYNEYCPADAAGSGGRALVGCVALSMAQIVKYYGYPSQGSGSNSYYHPDYGNQSVNFGTANYKFNNMPLNASANNSDLATFLYHCGVAVEMDYGPDGSGAYVDDACDALINNFGYDNNLEYERRSWYSDSQWKQLLKAEIDARRPMIYRGYSGQYGHAWNCDGYNDDLFHMNWGWGGSSNGFFNLDQMVAGSYDFSGGHRAGIHISPESNYPVFCSTTFVLDGIEGSFQDGSGPADYLNNTDCVYEIIPSCGQIISLSFDMIDLAAGDTIYVYDAISSDKQLLGTVDDSTSSVTFTSTKGSMLLNFSSNVNDVSNGWVASYHVRNCLGTKTYTEATGSLDDGSASCDYQNSSLCYWEIKPTGADSITLDFTSFDLYPDMDNLRIYMNEMTTANQVAKFNSSNVPSTVTIPAGKTILKFFTNSSENAGGWAVDYTAHINPLSNTENQLNEFSLFPNPASDMLYCKNDGAAGTLQVLNSVGALIDVQQIQVNDLLSINISELPAGVYFIRLLSDETIQTKRFIKQ